MIDLKKFKEYPHDEVFARGQDIYEGRVIAFVATKGGIEDWALYYMPADYAVKYLTDEFFFQAIKDMGDKIHDRETLKRILPVTDEVLDLYRD